MHVGANAMKKLARLLAIVAATCLGVATSHAASVRTWVSNAGTNNAQCSVTQPCLTFAQALAATSSGGEINCLTPGDFGPVEIGISVTIDCEGVSNGGIATSFAAAIAIDTAGIVVNLIGLELDGLNVPGSGPGVNITAPATVNIRNCKIYDFEYGGANGTGAGIFFAPNASGGVLAVDNVFVANNSYGIVEESSSGFSNMTVRNSNISSNSYGISATAFPGTHAGVTIEQTVLSFNNLIGLLVGSTGAVALVGGSTLVNNVVGVELAGGGIAYSFENNQIGGNGTDGTPLTAYPGGLN
jgi:hypothetical protein